MGKVSINESTLTAIGNAIRTKTEKTDLIAPGDMPAEILAIVSGGGGGGDNERPTDEDLAIAGNLQYAFSNNKFNWLIDIYGDRMTTKNVSGIDSMFSYATDLEEIPFDINCGGYYSTMYVQKAFEYCYNLRSIGKIVNMKPGDGQGMFNNCYRLRELPVFENCDWSGVHDISYQSLSNMFSYCYSLRSIPADFLKEIYNTYSSYFGCVYYQAFQNCYALDELRGIPVVRGTSLTSNCFQQTFENLYRAKNIIFDMNDDGTPYQVDWSNQVIDLSSVGYVQNVSNSWQNLTKYNSGITRDDEVNSAVQYEAKKNSPNWYAGQNNPQFARYNHDSAVNTINSLPITSGSGCVIKFPKLLSTSGADFGSATDGGAVSSLTEGEIAMAAAKGWTVSFSEISS